MVKDFPELLFENRKYSPGRNFDWNFSTTTGDRRKKRKKIDIS